MKDTTKVDKNDFLHKKNNVFQTIMPNHSVARIKPFQTVCPSLSMTQDSDTVLVKKWLKDGLTLATIVARNQNPSFNHYFTPWQYLCDSI